MQVKKVYVGKQFIFEMFEYLVFCSSLINSAPTTICSPKKAVPFLPSVKK